MCNNEWQCMELDKIVDFNPSETISREKLLKKISMDKLESNNRDIIGYEQSTYAGGSKFRNGDTIFSRITPCLENGKVAKVNILDDDEIAFGSTEFIIIRAKKDITDEDFVYYLMRSEKVKEIAIKSMIGSSGRQRVQIDVLRNTKISIPKLNEQKHIGSFLKLIDDKIAINKKINHHLEQMARSIFKSWFVDFEPFGGEIPTNWTKGGLTDIANFLNGLAMQRFRPLDEEKGLPVLKIKELRQGNFDVSSDLCSSNIKEQYIIQDGDVIFSWSGSLLVDFWTGGVGGLNQHLFKVSSEKYDKWFYFSWTQHHLEEFVAMAAARATTMGHIKRDALDKAEVLIPNAIDYKALGYLLEPIYNKQIENSLESKKLAELRDSLLPKLLSGEIPVT